MVVPVKFQHYVRYMFGTIRTYAENRHFANPGTPRTTSEHLGLPRGSLRTHILLSRGLQVRVLPGAPLNQGLSGTNKNDYVRYYVRLKTQGLTVLKLAAASFGAAAFCWAILLIPLFF